MLRVITAQHGKVFRLELHGTVAHEGLAVLEQQWREVIAKEPTATVNVDLSNVVFIDPHGERLLRRMAECGVTFEATGCMNRYVLERIAGV